MSKTVKCPCSRCHEPYIRIRYSRLGQVCPWCEEDLIALDRELSRKCGLRPLMTHDLLELNKYWQKAKALR